MALFRQVRDKDLSEDLIERPELVEGCDLVQAPITLQQAQDDRRRSSLIGSKARRAVKPRYHGSRVRTRTWLVWASLLFITLCAISILRSQSMTVDGRRVWWLGDDMMISMSYARSFAHGDGLVWYPGAPRVEGYSNLGWTLVMAAVHLLPLPSSLTSLPIMVLNVVLGVVVLGLTARLSRVLAPDAVFAAPATLLALAVSADLGMWAVNGWEFTLQTALFIWLVLRVLREARTGKPRPLTFLLAGALGIIRVDGILWSMSVVVLALILNRERRKVLLWSLLILLLPLAQVLFRLRYYGFPLPNTYYLKLTGWSLADRVYPALVGFYHFLRLYGLILLAATWGAWMSRIGQPVPCGSWACRAFCIRSMREVILWHPVLPPVAADLVRPGLPGAALDRLADAIAALPVQPGGFGHLGGRVGAVPVLDVRSSRHEFGPEWAVLPRGRRAGRHDRSF